MDKIMYYCKECNKLYKVGGSGKRVKCNSCGNELIDLKVTDEEYALMDTSEKNSLKYHASMDSAAAPTVEVTDNADTTETNTSPEDNNSFMNSLFGDDEPSEPEKPEKPAYQTSSKGSFFGDMEDSSSDNTSYEPIYAFDRPSSDFNNGVDPDDRVKDDWSDKKVNFFLIPPFSFVPTQYRRLVNEKGGKIFGALLVCFVILYIISGIIGAAAINDVTDTLRSELPDFELANDRLTIDEPMLMDQDDSYILVDDSISGVSASDVESVQNKGNYKQVLIMGGDSAGILSDGKIQVLKYSDLNGFSLSRSTLCDKWIPMLKPIIITCCVIGSFFSIGFYYIAALIIQLPAGAIATSVTKRELDKTDRFKITVLAKFPVFLFFYIIKKIGLPVGFWINVILQLALVTVFMCLYNREYGD